MKFQNLGNREILPTPYGDTFIRTIGRGPSVLVVHGGPGFDHRYLIEALAPLAKKRTLIFYDQLGCGQSGEPYNYLALAEIYRHFRWLAHYLSNGSPMGVIAHSWGTLVLIGSLADDNLVSEPIIRFDEGLLINPVPICAQKYKLCAINLLNRIPLIERIKIFKLVMLERDGAKIMKSLLPYYVEDVRAIPIDPFPLNKSIYRQISNRLRRFDYSSNLKGLSKLSVVMGMHDFVTLELVKELIPHISVMHKMEDIGHFPFWEAPEEFEKILMSSFG